MAEVEEEDVVDPVLDLIGKPTLLSLVYTGVKPVFSRMDKKKGKDQSLKHKARELGIYSTKLNRVGLEKAIEKYWINKCGGYEEYLKADIFRQPEQDITRDRKVRGSAKRKEEFAKSHKLEIKVSKRPKKAPLTNQVRHEHVCYYSMLLLFLSHWFSLVQLSRRQ